MQTKIATLYRWFISEGLFREADNLLPLLKEAKRNPVRSMINMGYPEVVAKILADKLGDNSIQVAKWFKAFNTRDSKYERPKDWLERIGSNPGGLSTDSSIMNLLKLYNATKSNEDWLKAKKELELSITEYDQNLTEDDLEERRGMLREEIEKDIHQNIFFYYPLFKDLWDGADIDLNPYRNLQPYDAIYRYDEHRLFEEAEPIKTYENGWRWINAGKKCPVLGNKMRNCGSAGVMSSDPDRTIIALFDEHNNPHVVVTYSPNENRISGDEGQASSEVKDIYHSYVIDLAHTLGAEFDTSKQGSKSLRLKWNFKDYIKNIDSVVDDIYDPVYKIEFLDGRIFYTNYYYFLSEADFNKAVSFVEGVPEDERGNIFGIYGRLPGAVFNYLTIEVLKRELGINYLSSKQVLESFNTL
jgi:hypothetical protein